MPSWGHHAGTNNFFVVVVITVFVSFFFITMVVLYTMTIFLSQSFHNPFPYNFLKYRMEELYCIKHDFLLFYAILSVCTKLTYIWQAKFLFRLAFIIKLFAIQMSAIFYMFPHHY